MIHSRIKWLLPVALTLVGFGFGVKSATAATYDFSVLYNTTVTINPFKPEYPDIVRATITGDATDAPYGLDFLTSNTYGQVNPISSTVTKTTFNADPTAFGLNSEPALSDRYYGGANELFGKASDSAVIDQEKGTISGGGTITITGGTGIFKDATGKITFTESDQLGPDPTAPSQGQAELIFSIKTPEQVPEPTATTTLVGLGVVGTGFVLRRQRRRGTVG
ncbi:MAG: PEP-CTERM sorting domain-containing protein [Stigonema ocellatum SAG 48.90 = DSM 106950]|nr:PEP-CTERM sorting domain-containing protein [Stigonema ocellatum SAG 48.90 = DSM 106950]